MIKTYTIDTKEQVIKAMLDIAGKVCQFNKFIKDGQEVTIEDIFDVTFDDPFYHVERRVDEILFDYIFFNDKNYFSEEVLRYIANEYERRRTPSVRDIIKAYADLYDYNIIHHYVTEFLELGVKDLSHYEGIGYTLHHINEMYVYSTEEYRDMIKNGENLDEDEIEELEKELKAYDEALEEGSIYRTWGWSRNINARFVKFGEEVYVVEEVL